MSVKDTRGKYDFSGNNKLEISSAFRFICLLDKFAV